jgi:hypothetical protein
LANKVNKKEIGRYNQQMNTVPEAWRKFSQYALLRAEEKGLETACLHGHARRLADEYLGAGYVNLTPTGALFLDDAVFALFYLEVGQGRFKEGEVRSPVADAPDSSWMYHSDYCFINVRALNPEPHRTGTFIHGLKVIPTVRASSLHLAPFFDCALDNLYAVESLSVITKHVLNHEMIAAGISAHEQLRLFIDGAHILGKTVGFDLEPHMGQFSRTAIANPEHFRWIRLSHDRRTLWKGMKQEAMLEESFQKEMHREVRERAAKILAGRNLENVKDTSRGFPAMRDAHLEIVRHLIAEGFWTLPSHTWNGVGLPEYRAYNFEKNHPEFTYLDKNGKDQHEHSFGMLTPFKLYTNLPLNKVPDKKNPPVLNRETIEFFKNLFPTVQRSFNFDFVRLDYVDHVFDSTLGDDPTLPVSDRMIPSVLKEVLTHAKKLRPSTGAMAERMGCDIGDYGKVGFDLLLGIDILTTMHADFIPFIFELQEEIEKGASDVKASILFAVDTHDSGHPLFWTKPLSEAVGPKGLALRHFLSRFTWTGRARRPKYEVIGNQDLSHGLYRVNNNLVSLTWEGDCTYNRRYHMLENVYESLRPLIYNALLGPRHVEKEYAWWFIDRADGVRERLLCIAALEKKFKKLKDAVGHEIAAPPPRELVINFRENYHFDNPEILEVSLLTGSWTPAPQLSHYQVQVAPFMKYDTRLFLVREKQG